MTVLIAHRDARVIGKLARAFHEKEVTVSTAQQGIEVLQQLRRARPDVVVWGQLEEMGARAWLTQHAVPMVELPEQELEGTSLGEFVDKVLAAGNLPRTSGAPSVIKSFVRSQTIPFGTTPKPEAAENTPRTTLRPTPIPGALRTPMPTVPPGPIRTPTTLPPTEERLPPVENIAQVAQQALQQMSIPPTDVLPDPRRQRITGVGAAQPLPSAPAPKTVWQREIRVRRSSFLAFLTLVALLFAGLHHGKILGDPKEAGRKTILADLGAVAVSIEQRIALIDVDKNVAGFPPQMLRDRAKTMKTRLEPQGVRRVVLVAPTGIPLISLGGR